MGGQVLADSHQLFHQHAFKDTQAPEEFRQVAEQAITACAGLPLTLEVVASWLAGKSTAAWKSACNNLATACALDGQKSPHSIFNRLSLSFWSLEPKQQDIFMDVACVLLGTPALEAAAGWGEHGSEELKLLEMLSLVGVRDGRLIMHDQLRDMGRALDERHVGLDEFSKLEFTRFRYAWDAGQVDALFKGPPKVSRNCSQLPSHMIKHQDITWPLARHSERH